MPPKPSTAKIRDSTAAVIIQPIIILGFVVRIPFSKNIPCPELFWQADEKMIFYKVWMDWFIRIIWMAIGYPDQMKISKRNFLIAPLNRSLKRWFWLRVKKVHAIVAFWPFYKKWTGWLMPNICRIRRFWSAWAQKHFQCSGPHIRYEA